MIGWKQALTLGRQNIVIVELEIPDDAVVLEVKNIKTGKSYLTTDYAITKSIQSPDGKHSVDMAVSLKDGHTYYEVGEMTFMNFDSSIGRVAGIYFFLTRQEAVDYVY